MAIRDLFASQSLRLRRKTEEILATYVTPTKDFFILICLATLLAVLGLALNNTAIVIGAMVVAPLVTPIFAMSLALLLFRPKRFFLSLVNLFLGTFLALAVSFFASILIIYIEQNAITVTNEILSRTEPNLLFFLVAVVSGLIGAYAYVQHTVLERLAGIAISVAIIPPLAVVGIQLAMTNFELAMQSAWLFGFNLLGISFGSTITFLLFGFGKEIEKE